MLQERVSHDQKLETLSPLRRSLGTQGWSLVASHGTHPAVHNKTTSYQKRTLSEAAAKVDSTAGSKPIINAELDATLRQTDNNSRLEKSPTSKKQGLENIDNANDMVDANETNPLVTSATATFGACLLVMDENHRLPEWIAYHYYMLPLRYLIVMVDSRSETSPKEILNQWKPYIRIEAWSDESIHFVPGSRNRTDATHLLWQFITRQERFYSACARYLRLNFGGIQQLWTTFHDVDEYMYLDPQDVPDAISRMEKPGSILQYVKDLQSKNYPRQRKMSEYGSDGLEGSCFYAERIYFGSSEESADIVQNRVPPYLNGSHFETLRFLHRARRDDSANNGRGKSIVNVKGPKPRLVFTRRIHRILKSCPEGDESYYSPIRIRHYIGSWEAYSGRRDCRSGSLRNRQLYEYRGQLGRDRPPDDHVRMWLDGFAKLMNNDQALITRLLRGVGQLAPPSKQLLNVEWDLTPKQIKAEIEREYDEEEENFASWLKERYNITTLINGTVLATRTKI